MSTNQEEFNSELGEKIRDIRSNVRKISQAEFADRVELSRPSVVNIEKGRQQISAYQLVVFAFVLGVSPMELLGIEIEAQQELAVLKASDTKLPKQFQDWFNHVQ